MSGQDIAMLVTTVVAGAAALLVVTSRNVVHAALFLVVTLLGAASTFLLVGAEFVAWAQVLVYVGAVVVLILFGLMLTRAPIGPMAVRNDNAPLAIGASVAMFAFLATMIFRSFGDVEVPLRHTPASALGNVIYTDWALPFMALGFFLTVALIGAIVIARREEGEGPEPELETEPIEHHEPSYSDASATPGVTEPGEEVRG